jgi:hypothetical protein
MTAPQCARTMPRDVTTFFERYRGAFKRFHTTYNLRRTGRGWRVVPCTAHEERPLDA